MNQVQSGQHRDELCAAFALTGLVKEGSATPTSEAKDQKATEVAKAPEAAKALKGSNPPLPSSTSAANAPSRSQANGKFVRKSFPQKLMEILNDERNSDIIRWLPCGTAFMIVDKKRFASEILPQYFKQTQFTSFTRKLTRWNFIRVPRGPLMGTYYHKFFQRQNPALCLKMSCNSAGAGLSPQHIPTAATAAKEVVRERSQAHHFGKVASSVGDFTQVAGLPTQEDMVHQAGAYAPGAQPHPLTSLNNVPSAVPQPNASSNVLLDKKMIAARMLEVQQMRRRYHVAQALYQARKAQEAQLALADLDLLKATNGSNLLDARGPESLLPNYPGYFPGNQYAGGVSGVPSIAGGAVPQQDLMNQLYLERLALQQDAGQHQQMQMPMNGMSVGNPSMMCNPPTSNGMIGNTPPPQQQQPQQQPVQGESGDSVNKFQASQAA